MPVSTITSCMVGAKSTLFYVDEDTFVHTLQASPDQESERLKGRETYDDRILKVNGQEVQSNTKDMVALSYTLAGSGTTRSRIYFSDHNNILQGFEREGDNPWTPSGIGSLNLSVTPGSCITALLSGPADAIKVYYFAPGSAVRPFVAWWSGSTAQWSVSPKAV